MWARAVLFRLLAREIHKRFIHESRSVPAIERLSQHLSIGGTRDIYAKWMIDLSVPIILLTEGRIDRVALIKIRSRNGLRVGLSRLRKSGELPFPDAARRVHLSTTVGVILLSGRTQSVVENYSRDRQ
jgi:hypothetical protein